MLDILQRAVATKMFRPDLRGIVMTIGDITSLEVDAIVNAANKELRGGSCLKLFGLEFSCTAF